MLNKILDNINKLTTPSIIAIDGRGASGKTTLANQLKDKLKCNVVHLDDFFLRPEQRTEERLSSPGGNVDHERFINEVLINLKTNQTFSYKPYICKTSAFGDDITITPNQITIIEGSYSTHPEFREFIDFSIFIDIDSEEQLKRIKERNGDTALKIFKEKWIPLEEKYFDFYNTRENCNLYIQKMI